MEIELLQIRTPKKQILRDIAESKGLSLNALMIMIIDDYLKREKNDKR